MIQLFIIIIFIGIKLQRTDEKFFLLESDALMKNIFLLANHFMLRKLDIMATFLSILDQKSDLQ